MSGAALERVPVDVAVGVLVAADGSFLLTSRPVGKVYDWAGEFEMREQQAMSWQQLPVSVQPVLPGTLPVLQWFAEERGFEGATHED